ncbi:hypothetical protein BST61_g1232 [Cercospora zeina]
MSPTDPRPRTSTETDRTLIATETDEEQQQQQHPTTSSRSRAASPARTLVENSPPTTTTTTPTAYCGFPSQAEYLAALHEWAEEKRYLQPSTTTVTGYYGTETLEAYANRPKYEFGISRRLRERREKKQGRKQSAG